METLLHASLSILVLGLEEGFFHLPKPHLDGPTWPRPRQHFDSELPSLLTPSLMASLVLHTWIGDGILLFFQGSILLMAECTRSDVLVGPQSP